MTQGKKLYRSTTDTMLAGVCAGLADYFGIDATIVRLIFVALLLSGTLGFWAYLVMWIVVPEEPAGYAKPSRPASETVLNAEPIKAEAVEETEGEGDEIPEPLDIGDVE